MESSAATDWGVVSSIFVAAITAAFAATQWIFDLRTKRLAALGVDRLNALFIQMVVLSLIAISLYITVAEILGTSVPASLYFGAMPTAALFAIAAVVGQLAERPSMWRLADDGRRVSLKWDRIRKIVVVPFVAPLAPLSTGALNQAPVIIQFFRG